MGRIVAILRQARADRLYGFRIDTAAGAPPRGYVWGSLVVIANAAQCLVRGFCVALLVLLPALLTPGISQDLSQGATLLALIAAIVVMAEYTASNPGLIEFRDAKPYNRTRFLIVFAIIMLVTFHQRDATLLQGSDTWLMQFAQWLGQLMDFSFSPVRLLVSSLPAGVPETHIAHVQSVAALAYLLSLLGILAFFVAIVTGYWPRRDASFNVWINLPNFDPTQGVDVVFRLERDAQINVLLGIVLPFSLPALLHFSSFLVQPVTLETPLALIWGVTLWAFIPVSLIMRGIGMHRVAQMIRAERLRMARAAEATPDAPRSAYS